MDYTGESNYDRPPACWRTRKMASLGAEWSSLVVRGREEQEERNEYLAKALETAMKELNSNK